VFGKIFEKIKSQKETKMNRFKKILCMLLCASMLVPAVGCSDGGADETTDNPSNTDTAPAETEPTQNGDIANVSEDYKWQDGVEQKSYGGYSYTILNGCTASWYSYTLIAPEETTGEPVNDAFYERNMRANEFLDIKIVENNNGDSVNLLKNEVKSDTNDFDVALCTLMNCYALAMENNVLDLNTISPDINLSNKWWDQNAANDLAINNKLYFTTSDFDTTRFDGIRALFFNKDIIAEHQMENPYNIVDEGKWTIEKFIEMCEAVTMDKDGDGKMTDTDRYGLVGYDEVIGDMLMYGMDARYIDKDSETGMLVDGTANEKFIDVYDSIISLMYGSKNATFDVHASKNSAYLRGLGDRAQEVIFTENNALFYTECLAWSRVMREMEADFGVLPPPKFDESQSRHYSVIINPFMQMIPITSDDPVRTLHVLDVLAAASHDTVVPAYVNITLTGKVARDADTVRMLNLVFDELAYNLHFTSISIRSVVQGALKGGNENISSSLQKNAKALKKQFEKTNSFFFDN